MMVMGIYGPTDYRRSRAFLEEISAKGAKSNLPLLMGGDFNLIRTANDKNNENLNWRLMDLSNEHIATWALREIPRSGARFTWTNRQLNPVRSVLDRVFISSSLETFSPCARLLRKRAWVLIIPLSSSTPEKGSRCEASVFSSNRDGSIDQNSSPCSLIAGTTSPLG
jgi:hypothetical protein